MMDVDRGSGGLGDDQFNDPAARDGGAGIACRTSRGKGTDRGGRQTAKAELPSRKRLYFIHDRSYLRYVG
jgi:hypothetical protein